MKDGNDEDARCDSPNELTNQNFTRDQSQIRDTPYKGQRVYAMAATICLRVQGSLPYVFKECRSPRGAHELAPARVSAQVPIVTFSHDGLRHAPVSPSI